jgi:plastocyanin
MLSAMQKTILCALTSSLFLLAAPAALADEQIRAAFSNRFENPNVEIDQGERLTFRNNDSNRHDVTAEKVGDDSKPLFSTALLGQNEEAVVEGSQYLTTGSYAFVCSVHANMKGTLTVNAAGTPVPRPGAGGTGGAADTTKPKVSASLRTTSVKAARKAFVVRVKADEETTYTVTVKRSGKTIARKVFKSVAAGSNDVKVKPTAKVKKGKVVVTVVAKDKAGNKTTVTKSVTLK